MRLLGVAFSAGLLFAASLALGAAGADKDDAWVASRKNYWAFKAPVRAEVPAVTDAWIRTPVDAFVLGALRAKGLEPSRPLKRERLLRRVTLDLTGLPPTPEDVSAFLADRSPGAFEKVVDRLMASPHYAERWAQKWLDIVRYADTNGYETDAERPHAWRYRDYVIRSFQSNKPYDRFVQEQIAGDELRPNDKDALIATGFHRAGPIHIVGGNQDEEMNRQEVLTEMTGVIGSAFLGMTVGCARCHNHKFDPIPQADYYRLQAVFAATEFRDVDISTVEERAAYDAAMKKLTEQVGPLDEQIKEIEKPYRERLKAEKRLKLSAEYAAALEIPKEKRDEEQRRKADEANAQLKVSWDEVLAVLSSEDKARRAELRKRRHQLALFEPSPPPEAFAVGNAPMPPVSFVLKVGEYKHKLDAVQPGFLRVVEGPDGDAPQSNVGRRSALARWLTSPENPLSARVMVNRIWQLRMGTGLVATPNDFGALGQRPSNQKLLDWLAVEFVSRGWDIRAIDRMILLSSVYQQDTAHDAMKAGADPENKLYWRMNRRRLDGEFLRDAALAASGSLNTKLYGKPVRVPIEPEVYDLIFTEGEPDNLWPVHPDRAEHNRRSLYLLNKRTVRLPMLANFDQPDAMTSCPIRPASTHALQALSLLNSDVMRGAARRFGERLQAECADEPCRVKRAYLLALAREPRAEEVAMAREFFAGGGPLEDFCLAMLNRNEFAYVP